MDLRKTFSLASEVLQKDQIAHSLIGGFALAVHGVHRATPDIHFLADGSQKDKIVSSLTAAGFTLRQSTNETLHFTGVGHLDILLANRPISLQMIADSARAEHLQVNVLRPEDIIGLKIQTYCNDKSREFQDKADTQSLIRTNKSLDWSRIQKYADLFNEWPTIQSLRDSK